MLRSAHRPKVHDWLVNYVVKKTAHAEELRQVWFADPDPVVASAGERIEVLKDYPTPPNCTSPFAPIWINEMVRRKPRPA